MTAVRVYWARDVQALVGARATVASRTSREPSQPALCCVVLCCVVLCFYALLRGRKAGWGNLNVGRCGDVASNYSCGLNTANMLEAPWKESAPPKAGILHHREHSVWKPLGALRIWVAWVEAVLIPFGSLRSALLTA